MYTLQLPDVCLMMRIPYGAGILHLWTTRVLYACSLIDIGEIFRFLRRKPRVLFALFVMESMCWLQFTLSVMVTPRYLTDVTAASNCPRMVYSVTMGFRFLVTVRTVHFARWNCMNQSSSHCESLSRSSWRCSASSSDVIVR